MYERRSRIILHEWYPRETSSYRSSDYRSPSDDSHSAPDFYSIAVPCLTRHTQPSWELYIWHANWIGWWYPSKWPIMSNTCELLCVRNDGHPLSNPQSSHFQEHKSSHLMLPLRFMPARVLCIRQNHKRAADSENLHTLLHTIQR